jgi:hypothetical protein
MPKSWGIEPIIKEEAKMMMMPMVVMMTTMMTITLKCIVTNMCTGLREFLAALRAWDFQQQLQ